MNELPSVAVELLTPPQGDAHFEKKKRDYFVELGLGVRDALAAHRQVGLRERSPETGEIGWKNVTEHCLVEAARARVFAKLLDLPNEVAQDLTTAAMLHDYSKKQEKEIVMAHGLTWESFDKASSISEAGLRGAGFGSPVVEMAHAVGHGSLQEMRELLEKEQLTPHEIALMVMHYIDDYTIGAEWVTDSDPLGARMEKNSRNERYKQLNEEGKARFGGTSTFDMQLQIGRQVEQRLATLVQSTSGISIAPDELPRLIDSAIIREINSL